jgi:hypothetical protein
MDATNNVPPSEPVELWFIGQHETSRTTPDGPSRVLREAQDVGYDMLTAPISTPDFQSKVVAQVEEHLEKLSQSEVPGNVPMPLISPFTPKDTKLTPDDSNSALIAVVSSWIDLGSLDPLIANISLQVFNLEMAYAAFCGIQHVMLHGPLPGSNVVQYARAVSESLGMGPYIHLNVLLPMVGELEHESGDGTHLAELAKEQEIALPEEDDPSEDVFSSWDTWDTLRTMCNYDSRLSVGKSKIIPSHFVLPFPYVTYMTLPMLSWLDEQSLRALRGTNQHLYKVHITAHAYDVKTTANHCVPSALEVPRQLPQKTLQSRWYSEPVRSLMFPHTTFLRNLKGFPVLSKGHQEYLTQFMRLRQSPWILLGDVDAIGTKQNAPTPEPTPAEAASAPTAQDPVPHLRYLRHLQQTQPVRAPIEKFGQGYTDYLQSPLQPLSDNLESVTYEVFEKDPIKYDWYERAVALALKDLSAKVGGREIVVAVVGAGRGPLVSKALMASKTSGVKIKAWAVEKNQNAYVHLQRRNTIDPLWNNNVTVVKTDMRAWKGPIIDGAVHKVDILVSELLGSFADNELSPECLDGVQHVLDPSHGVNIPQSYSAHMTPIATPRLYNDLLSRGGTEKWEIPYVVMFQQFDFLSLKAGDEESAAEADVQDAWVFSHPAPTAVLEQAEARSGGSAEHGGAGGAVGGDGSNEHNSRTCKVKFTVQNRGICHGLAGYFESVLYASESGEKVELSTNPVTMEAKSADMISWFPIFFPLKVSHTPYPP